MKKLEQFMISQLNRDCEQTVTWSTHQPRFVTVGAVVGLEQTTEHMVEVPHNIEVPTVDPEATVSEKIDVVYDTFGNNWRTVGDEVFASFTKMAKPKL